MLSLEAGLEPVTSLWWRKFLLPSICFMAQKLTAVLFSKEIGSTHTYAQSMLVGSAEKIIALDALFVDEIKVSFFLCLFLWSRAACLF